jgi:hypothetical protein
MSLSIFGVHLILNIIFSSLGEDLFLRNPEIWKPMGPSWMLKINILYFMFSFIFSYFYLRLKDKFFGEGIKKGIFFGLFIFLFSYFPRMGIMYFSMTVPGKLILIWIITGAVRYTAFGITASCVESRV